ncbi:MAG: hypothetical protein O7H41_19580 [Planctomycetota bacterium]|nr:hypothetical protein [Planctomycetota bacterium]
MDARKAIQWDADELSQAARGLGMSDIYLAEDIARLFYFPSLDAARCAIRAGKFGPYSRLGKRLILRRRSVLDHLAEREVSPRQLGPRILPKIEEVP